LETNHLPQPNVATLAPPDAAVITLLGSPAAISYPSLGTTTRTLNCSGGRTSAVDKGIPSRLIFSGERVPVAIGPCLAKALDSRWQTYREQLRLCQEEFSEEAVHELRVATRRLLAQFTLLACVVPSADLEKARRALKRRLAALGDLRDIQVQRMFIDGKTASFPELVLLRLWLERRERRLAKSAAREVKRFKARKLQRWISALRASLTANARTARAQGRLGSLVLRATSRAFAEAVERRQAIDPADLRTIHRTRVAFKRFRYIMESLSPALTGLSKRQLRALAYYQRRMGIIQDLEVMRSCLASYMVENKRKADLLRPFCRHLNQRRDRALRSFLVSADRLFEFWPPARLDAPGMAASNNTGL
jgi:CHAD domain-containing protein